MKKKFRKSLIIWSLMFFSSNVIASYSQVGPHKTINVLRTFEAGEQPGKWIRIQTIDLPTYELANTDLCTSTELCLYGETSLGYNGKANLSLKITTHHKIINDTEGRRFEITAAFPDGMPTIGITERNHMGGRKWTSTYGFPDFPGYGPSDSDRGFSSRYIQAQGYCGAVAGCPYSMASYFHTSTKKPALYVKIPDNIKPGTITFQNVPVLTLSATVDNKAHNDAANPVPRELRISGTLTIPQRCYLTLTGSSSIDFGQVYTNNADGLVAKRTGTIQTTCNFAPAGTQQYLKVEGVTGGTLSNDQYVYGIANDNKNNTALGFVFNLNNEPECSPNGESKNKFNKEYLIRNLGSNTSETYTDKINFGLCKYGIPAISGHRSVSIRVVSRWVNKQ